MLEDRDVKSRKWTESSSWGWAPRLFLAQVLPPAKACPAPASQPPFLHLLQREGRMSEPSWKSSQPLASEQRSVRGGGGGTLKQPGSPDGMALVGAGEPSEVPTPKTPRARQRGAKHKSAAKTRNTATAPGRKPRSKPPKKLEKEEEEGILQESPLAVTSRPPASSKEQFPAGTAPLGLGSPRPRPMHHRRPPAARP